MKLHLNTTAGQNTIFGHGPGYIDINGSRLAHPVIVTPDKLISPWNVIDLATLNFADFDEVIRLEPALVIFGAGSVFRFPDPRIMAAFSKAHIGFDVMDTAAACRTYNVLMSEGRRVAAALLIG